MSRGLFGQLAAAAAIGAAVAFGRQGAPGDAIAPGPVAGNRELEEEHQLRRLCIDPGPLAFVDACDRHAMEVAFGPLEDLDGISFEAIGRAPDRPAPVKRARLGEAVATERATAEDLATERHGVGDRPGDDGWRDIPDDEGSETADEGSTGR